MDFHLFLENGKLSSKQRKKDKYKKVANLLRRRSQMIAGRIPEAEVDPCKECSHHFNVAADVVTAIPTDWLVF